MRSTRAVAQARVRAERNGRVAEWLTVLLLWLKGYRVLARRWCGPGGELDIVAVRGTRLAFVEVKYRSDGAALAVSHRQCQRLHATAAAFVGRYRRYAAHTRGFDAVFVVPGRWPVHAPDHLAPAISGRALHR